LFSPLDLQVSTHHPAKTQGNTMKNVFSKFIFIFFSIAPLAVFAQAALQTDQQKFSYAVGVQVGQNIAQQGMNIDNDALLQGISDIVKQQELRLSMEELQLAVNNFQAAEEARYEKLAQENKQIGEKFLADNKAKKGVTELASGLQYIVHNEGQGAQPKVTDTVVVHYRGSLIDGTEFDSSYARGEPMPVPLEGVIEGWQEAVPLMKTGSKWQVFIPSSLGYGENAAGPMIGPNSTLIFDIELIAIQ
jgi:FKBP-type peptidyl-prolyl cis-trans isomerase FklB